MKKRHDSIWEARPAPLQVPVAFGHWLVAGRKLVCRLPRRMVTVRAPNRLLRAVMASCDGSLTWAAVMAKLEEQWDAVALNDFMKSLADHGVLVEASQLWAYWADVAQLPMWTSTGYLQDMSVLAQVAEKRLLPGHGLFSRDASRQPLTELLSRRETARTFADEPISIECLCAILWAAHGVARPGSDGSVAWHRTIASGGNMHSVRWFVALVRDLPSDAAQAESHRAGLYEARFHTLGGVSLQKLPGHISQAWRCLRDPRVLRFASALIFPVYDIATPGHKYGNRATLFALIEAGQALQNAQLMSTALGAAGMLRGDTVAQTSLQMLGLANGSAHWFVMPAMVVGACPSAQQMHQQRTENALKLKPNLTVPGDSFAFTASGNSPQGLRLVTSGRSKSPTIAITKAEAEGWERLGWATLGSVYTGRIGDVADAIDPREVVAYSAQQYEQLDFPFKPLSTRRQYLWIAGVDTQSGRGCSVLADCVYAYSVLPLRYRKSAFTSASTSGVAAGVTHDDALCRATLELIERDAFVCAWLRRSAPKTIKSESLPFASAHRVGNLVEAGLRVVVADIGTAWAPVVSVFAQSETMPFTAITAAAHFSPEEALEKALDEMEGRFAQALRFEPTEEKDVDPMRQIESFYRSRRNYRRSDFYAAATSTEPFKAVGQHACRTWRQLQSRIARDGFRLLSVDVTPDNAAVDQGRLLLRVVRAIIPGLVPIWFQDGMQPEVMPRFAESAGSSKDKHAKRFFLLPFT